MSTPHQEIQHVEGGGGRGFGKAKAKDAIEMSREKMRARLAELEEERRRLDMQRRKLQAGRREKKQQPTKRRVCRCYCLKPLLPRILHGVAQEWSTSRAVRSS